MTNNFDLMREYMSDLGLTKKIVNADKSDTFFDIQIIRRGKDHPNLPSANYIFKTYYVTSIEYYDRMIDEIIKCCDMFKMRAYISVNIKSREKALKKCLEKMANYNVMNDYRSPWKAFHSICGGLVGKDKRWLVDIDDCDENSDKYKRIISIIKQCKSSFNEPCICSIKTKSGIHIITHPFNLKDFKDICKQESIEEPDVQKNHLTLLYENLN